MKFSACLLMTLWLNHAGLPAYAGNYTCQSCSSDVEGFYCAGCNQPVEPDGHELTPHGPAIRAQAFALRGVVNANPSPGCSKASRFNLHNLNHDLSIYYWSENPLDTELTMGYLFPDDSQYNHTHHVLFLDTPKGWLRIYLFFESGEQVFVQVNSQWFYFSSWSELSQWLAFLLATLQEANVYAYRNLTPDSDDDHPGGPPALKTLLPGALEFVDR